MAYNKTIHQIWFDLGNGKNIPDKYKKYQESWKMNHKDWKYVLWDEIMGDNLMKNHFTHYFDLYKNVKYPIMKIDILRYCILYKFGGMYVDMDYNCLNNFDNYLMENQYEIYLNEQPNETYNMIFGRSVSNSLMISAKANSPFWKIVIDECFQRIKTYTDWYHIFYVVKTSGPGLVNDMLIKHNDKTIHILPFSQFNYCNDCNVCNPSKTNKLYAVHDYASYWNSSFWLRTRKIFSCISFCDLLIIILVIYFLFQLGYRFLNS